ncbi:uncharacterized protein LOC111454220 [Cucurbita moschata]|uniref:Uncharacterized protein LOC111454220 n=1 Tax=Cucurbita moschata TaxID=3662 RepID=A0A6J1GIH7_CUCMO|nr:uncharacterized protein LOC111454220 [Cucurbita moschata]
MGSRHYYVIPSPSSFHGFLAFCYPHCCSQPRFRLKKATFYQLFLNDKIVNLREALSLLKEGHAKLMDVAADDLAAHKSGSIALNMLQKLYRSGMKPLSSLSPVFEVFIVD